MRRNLKYFKFNFLLHRPSNNSIIQCHNIVFFDANTVIVQYMHGTVFMINIHNHM